jgi:hypothetical protein
MFDDMRGRKITHKNHRDSTSVSPFAALFRTTEEYIVKRIRIK